MKLLVYWYWFKNSSTLDTPTLLRTKGITSFITILTRHWHVQLVLWQALGNDESPKCMSACTAVCLLWTQCWLSRQTTPLLSWRPFSVPHDSVLIHWPEDMETAERCVCVLKAGPADLWAGLQLHLVTGGHRSNNKTPESKSDLLHNSHHTLSGAGGEVTRTWKRERSVFHCVLCVWVWVGKVRDVSAKPLI